MCSLFLFVHLDVTFCAGQQQQLHRSYFLGRAVRVAGQDVGGREGAKHSVPSDWRLDL